MRILFVAPGPLGDTVISTVLLRALLQRHPGAEVTVACGPIAVELFTYMPGLREVIAMEKRGRGLHWLRLWARLWRTRWDLVVDVRGSALGLFLWPTCWKWSAWKSRRSRKGHKTAQMASMLGLDPVPLPIVWTGPEERARAATRIPPGRQVIILAPTAASAHKIWPAERFVQLAAALRAGPLPEGEVIVLAGPGEGERVAAERVRAAIPGATALYGHALAEVVAHLERCALFVGNDSGSMHLAAAAGAPTLGLFGPGFPAEYAPAGPRTAVAISPDRTMAGLSVEQALEVARGLA